MVTLCTMKKPVKATTRVLIESKHNQPNIMCDTRIHGTLPVYVNLPNYFVN
jgi:hypothetical protein